MNRRAFLALVVLVPALCAAEQGQPVVLFDFGDGFDIGAVVTSDAEVTLSRGQSLRIETGHEKQWPGITLKAPAEKWDLSKYEYVSVDVKNSRGEPVTVSCRVDNPGADGTNKCVTDSITLAGRQAGTLIVRMLPTPWRFSEPLELIGILPYPVPALSISRVGLDRHRRVRRLHS